MQKAVRTLSASWFIGILVTAACHGPSPPDVKTPVAQQSRVRFAQIDLSKIGPVAPKGRVQDTDYNHLPVVESLIAHGTEAIPFLIDKLEDETKIQTHVFDYWSEVRVGDVAFVILTNFFTEPTLKNTTIPGVGYDAFLKRELNSNVTGEQLLRDYIVRHGRDDIAKRWRQIWDQYGARAYWDEKDRCFKVRT